MISVWNDLGEDERAILEVIAERLLFGQKNYGKFDLLTDKREFLREAFEEDLDGLVYRAALLVRERRQK